MEGGYQSACEGGLRSCVHIVALECCCELAGTIKVCITKSTTHEKVGALKIIPVVVSEVFVDCTGFTSLTAMDRRDRESVAVRWEVDQRVCGLQRRLLDQYVFGARSGL